MFYELKLQQFSGPIGKLLELIEDQKLEVTEISLAQVTDDFLKYLKTIENIDTAFLADFISVASRLIFLKSKFLLPDFQLTADEEAEIKDLERRIKLYQELKPAMKTLARLWREGNKQFGRPYFLNVNFLGSGEGGRIFYPGRDLASPAFVEFLERILDIFKKLELEIHTIKEKIITIEEKIQEVINRLQREGETSFSSLSRTKPVAEIIAVFLAILYLAREQAVFLEQNENFSDIIIKHQSS